MAQAVGEAEEKAWADVSPKACGKRSMTSIGPSEKLHETALWRRPYDLMER